MRRRLWVAAALAPLSFAATAHAQTTISSGTSTPVTTSGAGGYINIDTDGSIGSTATTAAPTLSPPAAVTINSNASASSLGAITLTGYNNVAGIQALGGYSGVITNTGSITLNETTNYKDTNGDGVVDTNGSNAIGVNLFASGTNRYGIYINGAGVGAFGSTANTAASNQAAVLGTVGTIINSGTIAILGENSAGIYIDTGGMNGDLLESGSISVTGGNPSTNDHSYGIYSNGLVNGNVNISGSITALGQNASAVTLNGGVTGQVTIWGTLTATGYESAAPIPTSSLQSQMQAQAAEELLQGGPALQIGGDVAGGINITAAIAASVNGTLTTSATAGSSISVEGSAPAILIGGATGGVINIGPITGNSITTSNNYGMVVGGTVTASNLFPFLNASNTPINATAISIGDSNLGVGGAVFGGAGISITGAVSASTIGSQILTDADDTTPLSTSVDTATGNATGVFLGAVTAQELDVSGSVRAAIETQTLANGTIAAPTATAIQLGAGANVPTISNAGVIASTVTGLSSTLILSNGGTEGYAYGILDQSGKLTTVTNYDSISAQVVPINAQDLVNRAYTATVAVQFDNPAGTAATLDQEPYPVTVTDGTTTTLSITPTIIGDVLFGAGAGNVTLNAGLMTGGIQFGASTANSLSIQGGSISLGQISEAAGGELAINVGTGGTGILGMDTPVTNTLWTTQEASSAHTPAPTGPSAADVAIGVSSLTIGANGQVLFGVYAPNSTYTAAQIAEATGPQFSVAANGNVSIASGGTVGLVFLSKLTGPTTYNIIEAPHGQITSGYASINSVLGDLPFLYAGTASITAADASHDYLSLTVVQKTLAQMGLNPAQQSAFNAFYNAFDATDDAGSGAGTIAGAVLSETTKAGFQRLFNEFLPDYSGGPFDTLVMGQDQLTAAETEAPAKLAADGQRGWVQEIGVSDSRSSQDVVGYSGKGFGIAGGTENVSGSQAVGVAMAMVTAEVGDSDRPVGSSQSATVIEGGVYWRAGEDGLNVGAALNGGWAFLQSHRVLLEQSGTADASLYEQAKAHWNGGLVSASFNMAYKAVIGRYFFQPEANLQAVMLYETAYKENGAGAAVDLAVNSKLNEEGIAQGDMVMGATYGTATKWTPSVTVGWRQVVWGGPSDTTAHFQGGQSFTLSPDFTEKGGMLARLGLRATGAFADFSANAGGVFSTGYDAVDARATARFLF